MIESNNIKEFNGFKSLKEVLDFVHHNISKIINKDVNSISATSLIRIDEETVYHEISGAAKKILVKEPGDAAIRWTIKEAIKETLKDTFKYDEPTTWIMDASIPLNDNDKYTPGVLFFINVFFDDNYCVKFIGNEKKADNFIFDVEEIIN